MGHLVWDEDLHMYVEPTYYVDWKNIRNAMMDEREDRYADFPESFYEGCDEYEEYVPSADERSAELDRWREHESELLRDLQIGEEDEDGEYPPF